MGWKGTVRSVSAAMRAAERESQRRNKQLLKEQITEEAADAVTDWKNYCHDLISLHTHVAERVDWQSLATSPEPSKPTQSNEREQNAQAELDSFVPKRLDFLRGGSAKRRVRLEQAVADAAETDRRNFEEQMAAYEAAVAEWKEDTALANRVLANEAAAKKEVIGEMQTFTTEDLIGRAVVFHIGDEGIHAVPTVHSDEVVPNFRRKQLASGRLSETKMPVGEFNELYQDYVCSVALRVAGDLFSILPDDELHVSCVATMLNTKTGHQEPTPILSVFFVRATFEGLKLTHLDPSDALANFNHTMAFKRTKGFAPIEPLKAIPEE